MVLGAGRHLVVVDDGDGGLRLVSPGLAIAGDERFEQFPAGVRSMDREDLSEFARYDAQVLGLSIDTIPTIKAWAKSLGSISYPLLSDFWPHGLTALKYGVLRAEGFTERAIFIIDKKGIIRYIDVHPIGDQPKNSVLFEELKKIEG